MVSSPSSVPVCLSVWCSVLLLVLLLEYCVQTNQNQPRRKLFFQYKMQKLTVLNVFVSTWWSMKINKFKHTIKNLWMYGVCQPVDRYVTSALLTAVVVNPNDEQDEKPVKYDDFVDREKLFIHLDDDDDEQSENKRSERSEKTIERSENKQSDEQSENKRNEQSEKKWKTYMTVITDITKEFIVSWTSSLQRGVPFEYDQVIDWLFTLPVEVIERKLDQRVLYNYHRDPRSVKFFLEVFYETRMISTAPAPYTIGYHRRLVFPPCKHMSFNRKGRMIRSLVPLTVTPSLEHQHYYYRHYSSAEIKSVDIILESYRGPNKDFYTLDDVDVPHPFLLWYIVSRLEPTMPSHESCLYATTVDYGPFMDEDQLKNQDVQLVY